MEDLIKSIKAHLYDKATSPLFGTFAIAWAAWNYKFIMVLFSSLPVNSKFEYISVSLYPTCNSYLSKGILFPLLTTIIFIFVYPYPAKWVYSFARKQQKQLREIKAEIEDETPLTKEESRIIRSELTNLELKHEKELEIKNTEINKLKLFIDEFKNGETSINLPPSNMDTTHDFELDEEQLVLLKFISENEKILRIHLIAQLKLQDKIEKTRYHLGELERKKLIYVHDPGEEPKYSITHLGRQVLVDTGML